jgi:nucleotide-binding universal stress UspA family protein
VQRSDRPGEQLERNMAIRQLGIALDFSESSNAALKWAIDNLLRDGDKLILLIVVKKTDEVESPEQMWGAHGSPLIPYGEFMDEGTMKRYGVTVSPGIAESLTNLRGSKNVEILAKVYYGDAKVKILDAIVELPLDSLCMGSRGLGGLKKVFLGSVSDYVVNNSPCPITVVKLASEVGTS